MKKILITGGHPTPAFAVIETLLSKRKFDVVYIGKKNILTNNAAESWEYQEIKKLNLKFYDFKGGKLQRNFDLSLFKSLYKIPSGLSQARKILNLENPDCIISFGGYIAFPFEFWLCCPKRQKGRQYNLQMRLYCLPFCLLGQHSQNSDTCS